jgi:N-acetyl-gamma-glutamyl-phosphate reductase
MIKIGIVGGTAYAGVELLRLLAQQPRTEVVTITSRGDVGASVANIYPSLHRCVGLKFEDPAKANFVACDTVFFATPSGCRDVPGACIA